MSDSKSKFPDLNEIGTIAGKLFKDIKQSVVEIIDDYKQKHPQTPEAPKPVDEPVVKAKAAPKKDEAKDDKKE